MNSMYSDEGFSGGWFSSEAIWTLKEQITAFQMTNLENDVEQFGAIVRLPAGAVKNVRYGFQSAQTEGTRDFLYFVFIQDLEAHSRALGQVMWLGR